MVLTMWGCPASATPHALDGASSLAPGEHRLLPVSEPALFKWTRATAEERWSVSASAHRDPWDGGIPMARFAARDAVDGIASRAWLGLDWQRAMSGSLVQARAFALRRDVGLQSGIAFDEGASEAPRYVEQRERASSVGAMLAFTRLGSRICLASRGDSLDAEERLNAAGGRALATLREDRLRQDHLALDARQSLDPARWLRVEAGARLERYAFRVRSDLQGHGGAAAGTLLSPRLSVFATLPTRAELFFNAHRGSLAEDARAAAALDPRNRAPLGQLDPLSTARHVEAGLRTTIFPGLELRGSFGRILSTTELMLSGDDTVRDLGRPGSREVLRLGARYHAASWLALDLDGALVRARFDDGAGEAIPDAARRYATAGATVRPRRGWSASLFVSHFATEASADEEGVGLRSSTLVNGRVTHQLSKRSRLTLDVFNVFDQRIGGIDYQAASRLWGQPGMAEDFLFHPAEPRGFRVRFRTTF